MWHCRTRRQASSTARRRRHAARGGHARTCRSLAEAAGIRDIDVDIWYALYAPAGTPRAIVAKLNEDTVALLRAADVREALGKQGLLATGGTPEQLGELTRTELARWAKVVRDANIQAD